MSDAWFLILGWWQIVTAWVTFTNSKSCDFRMQSPREKQVCGLTGGYDPLPVVLCFGKKQFPCITSNCRCYIYL